MRRHRYATQIGKPSILFNYGQLPSSQYEFGAMHADGAAATL